MSDSPHHRITALSELPYSHPMPHTLPLDPSPIRPITESLPYPNYPIPTLCPIPYPWTLAPFVPAIRITLLIPYTPYPTPGP